MNHNSKPCVVCGNPFYRKNRISADNWRRQVTCSRKCAAAYRRAKSGKMVDVAKARERSKASMNAHWRIQQQRAVAKRFAIASRADELAAIEQHLAEHGITVCPVPEQEADPVRSTLDRPQVQMGWRG